MVWLVGCVCVFVCLRVSVCCVLFGFVGVWLLVGGCWLLSVLSLFSVSLMLPPPPLLVLVSPSPLLLLL